MGNNTERWGNGHLGLKYPLSVSATQNLISLDCSNIWGVRKQTQKSVILRGCQQGMWQSLQPHLAFLQLAPRAGGRWDVFSGDNSVSLWLKGRSRSAALLARAGGGGGAGVLHFAFHSYSVARPFSAPPPPEFCCLSMTAFF